MAEHSPARILQVRAKFYDLLSHCIPATTILKVRIAYSIFDPDSLLPQDAHFQVDPKDRRYSKEGRHQVVGFL